MGSQSTKYGNQRIPIPYDKVKVLAEMQCTYSEIAAVCDVSLSLIKKRWTKDPEFRRLVERGKHRGRASLRRWQYRAASNGNITMLLWLGKQYLNQRDLPVDSEDPNDFARDVSQMLHDMDRVTGQGLPPENDDEAEDDIYG